MSFLLSCTLYPVSPSLHQPSARPQSRHQQPTTWKAHTVRGTFVEKDTSVHCIVDLTPGFGTFLLLSIMYALGQWEQAGLHDAEGMMM